ncbi:MAG: hypothetical protein WAV05_09405 [Anaerolineales bacterium]
MKTDLLAGKNNRRLYLFIALGCGLFVILTLIAMLTYAGGAVDDHSANGYSFTHNFLSNLGMVTAPSGRPNWASAILFFISLGTAGVCLVIFFIIFLYLFQHSHVQTMLSLIGSAFGVLAGISFVGIAFAPADLARPAHIQFVMWAFRLFPLAVLFYVPVMFLDKVYPKAYAWVFALFCLLLIGYYLLLTNGPSFSSPQGLVIQVVGQKVIAYASVVSIGVQSQGVYWHLGKTVAVSNQLKKML